MNLAPEQTAFPAESDLEFMMVVQRPLGERLDRIPLELPPQFLVPSSFSLPVSAMPSSSD